VSRALLLVAALAQLLLMGCFHVQLAGSVAGATVTVEELDNPGVVLASAESWDEAAARDNRGEDKWSGFNAIQKHLWLGVLLRPDFDIDPDTYYLLTASGGEDFDIDHDIAMDAVGTEVSGQWHAIMKGEHLLGNGYKISVMSEVAYQRIRDVLPGLYGSELEARLDAIARQLVSDINGDCEVNYEDVIRWSTVVHRDDYRGRMQDLDDMTSMVLDGGSLTDRYDQAGTITEAIAPILSAVCGEWQSSGGPDPASSANSLYQLTVTGATTVALELYAKADSYLYLLDETLSTVDENDDWGEHGVHSRVSPYLEAGTYYLVAATVAPGKTGPHRLLAAAAVDAPAMKLRALAGYNGTDYASVGGIVTDQQGDPLSGATVLVSNLDPDHGQPNITLNTDSEGGYFSRIDADRLQGEAFTATASATGCEGAGPSDGTPDANNHATIHFQLDCSSTGDGLLLSPYSNLDDIRSVFPYYDSHRGLDFATTAELKPFRASAAGVVRSVNLVQLGSTGNWQVEVDIDISETLSMLYAFEPLTANQADGETQLANISVVPGQSVAQGEEIGLLYTAGAPGEGSHVHWGLFEFVPNGGDPAVCPEPYFTDAARAEILGLIRQDNPGAEICN